MLRLLKNYTENLSMLCAVFNLTTKVSHVPRVEFSIFFLNDELNELQNAMLVIT